MNRDNSERAKAAKDLTDIRKLIDEIDTLWEASYFDEIKARKIIKKVNDDHPENTGLYNLITYRTATTLSSGVSIDCAATNQLQQDLEWKHFYLNAKLLGKAAEEIIKEWSCMNN